MAHSFITFQDILLLADLTSLPSAINSLTSVTSWGISFTSPDRQRSDRRHTFFSCLSHKFRFHQYDQSYNWIYGRDNTSEFRGSGVITRFVVLVRDGGCTHAGCSELRGPPNWVFNTCTRLVLRVLDCLTTRCLLSAPRARD